MRISFIRFLSSRVFLVFLSCVLFLLVLLFFSSSVSNAYDNNNLEHTLDTDVISAFSDKEFLSLNDFGAIGDGTTDNFEQLSNAINVSIELNKSLYIPSGKYYSSKMISIDGPIHIFGESIDSSFIIFKDNVQFGIKPQYWQRGICTFKGNNFSLENLTLQYESNFSTQYNKSISPSGHEGVLLSILDAININITNVRFLVSGTQNPSLTCVWLKSETSDIKDVNISNCIFDHETSSTIGGGLWVSAHDNSSTCLENINVNNCIFNEYAHDESLSVWGYNVSNIDISHNTFNYLGTATFAEALIGFGSPDNSNYFTNVFFRNNNFSINNNVRNAILINKIPNNSSIFIEGNTFNAELPSDLNFSCIGLSNCGNINIADNTYNISGTNITTYLLFDNNGNIYSKNETFNAYNCLKFTLIRSRYSKNFVGARISISDSQFYVASMNSTKGIPTIQYPLDSILNINNTSIDTSKSILHEIVYQTLSSPTINSGLGLLDISHLVTDSDIFMNIKETDNRKIVLTNSSFGNLYCTSNCHEFSPELLELNNCSYNNVYLNSLAVK